MFHVPLTPTADPEVKFEENALAQRKGTLHRFGNDDDSLFARWQLAQQPKANRVFYFFV